MAEQREPLSFWGTVGAFMTGGIILSTISFGVTILAGRAMIRSQVREALQEPTPPNNGNGNGGGA